ncbi:MAG: hypothetical protein ABIH39_06345 [Candidatus Margulisiibacteriota bacterium]
MLKKVITGVESIKNNVPPDCPITALISQVETNTHGLFTPTQKMELIKALRELSILWEGNHDHQHNVIVIGIENLIMEAVSDVDFLLTNPTTKTNKKLYVQLTVSLLQNLALFCRSYTQENDEKNKALEELKEKALEIHNINARASLYKYLAILLPVVTASILLIGSLLYGIFNKNENIINRLINVADKQEEKVDGKKTFLPLLYGGEGVTPMGLGDTSRDK